MTKTIDSRQNGRTGVTRPGWRTIGALMGALALGAALLSGCGGEAASSDRAATGSTEQQSGHESDEAAPDSDGNPPRAELPEGFPADVPLPGFHTAKKIGGSADTGFWSVLLQLTDSTDTPVEDYAAQLTDAGYTVEDGPGGKEATNDTWDLSFHSALNGTLTVSVIES